MVYSRDQIKFAELTKKINKKKISDIWNHIGKIEEAVKNGGSIKSARRKLGIAKNKIYAVKHK